LGHLSGQSQEQFLGRRKLFQSCPSPNYERAHQHNFILVRKLEALLFNRESIDFVSRSAFGHWGVKEASYRRPQKMKSGITRRGSSLRAQFARTCHASMSNLESVVKALRADDGAKETPPAPRL
jgi:hypothetical protein